MSKIGVGIITCNRNDFYIKCINSIKSDWYDEIVTINDGDDPIATTDAPHRHIINNGRNLGVCKSKNKALTHLLSKGCDYIFLVEDDMLFKDNAFKEYIKASKATGIQHMSFAYHGPANKGNISKGTPKPRKIIDYGDVKIALNQHSVGAVCFYTKESLDDVGIFDEEFDKNNFEHVEHSYSLAKAGYSTPYWWWADLANSCDFIEEQACSEESSSIRRGDDWQQKIIDSAYLFQKKHGYMPAWQNAVPDTPLADVINILKSMRK
jgi:GT2 family glycosyltransferase|tara:strand:+ start:5723 stop:6517 length:795 start_codon:yes stop_codon:yes gene_type:complete